MWLEEVVLLIGRHGWSGQQAEQVHVQVRSACIDSFTTRRVDQQLCCCWVEVLESHRRVGANYAALQLCAPCASCLYCRGVRL